MVHDFGILAFLFLLFVGMGSSSESSHVVYQIKGNKENSNI